MSVGKPKPGNAELQLGHHLDRAELELGVPKGWHSRGYIPHRDELHLLQSITFRLADSLPQSRLRQLEGFVATLPAGKQANHKRQQIESWLDAGMGSCALAHPTIAEIVQSALLHSDGERYRLMAWCIMPNHVHVLNKPLQALSRIVQSWKSFTGRWAMTRNAELELGAPRTLQLVVFDRTALGFFDGIFRRVGGHLPLDRGSHIDAGHIRELQRIDDHIGKLLFNFLTLNGIGQRLAGIFGRRPQEMLHQFPGFGRERHTQIFRRMKLLPIPLPRKSEHARFNFRHGGRLVGHIVHADILESKAGKATFGAQNAQFFCAAACWV